jgi:hypothetical protein
MVTTHLVNDLDADPTGDEPIDYAFEAIKGTTNSPQRLVVPAGTYRIENEHRFGNRKDNPDLSIVSERSIDSEPEPAARFGEQGRSRKPVFQVREGFVGALFDFRTDIYLNDIDIRRPTTESHARIEVRPDRKALISNVDILGETVVEDVMANKDGQIGPVFAVDCGFADGTVTFHNIDVPATTTWDGSLPHDVLHGAVYGMPGNRATVWVEDSTVTEHPGPAIDMAHSHGAMKVVSGRFENCNGPQIRGCSGEDSIEDITAIVDPDESGAAVTADYEPLSGIAVSQDVGAGDVHGGPEIDNALVRIHSGSTGTVQAGIWGDGSAGDTMIAGSDVTVDVDDVPALKFTDPRYPSDVDYDRPDLTLRNIILDGGAYSGPAIDVSGWDAVIDTCCIEQPYARIPWLIEPRPAIDTAQTDAACSGFRGSHQ